jgi:hypothetical protein
MAEFIINQDVVTDVNAVEVTITPRTPLRAGRHSFQLIVTDDSGNISAPDRIEIIVADQDAPTAVLAGPRIVATGRSFNLDGSRSIDAGGGTITRYTWTYMGPTDVIR